MSQKSDPHAGHRPGSFMEAVSWLNRSAYGEKLSCYSLREAVAKVVERECYLRREIERLEAERDALLSRPAPPADAAREAVPSMVALRGAIPDLVRGAVPDFPPYQTIPPEITARLDVAETALEEIIAESERWHDDGWTGAHVAFTALGGRKRRALSAPAVAATKEK